MISLYNKNETDFTHNGIVLSDLISCEIEEELNGKYILELEHLIDEKGKWKYLQEEAIIKADGQLFRIHSIEKNLNSISVTARHIFYDLLHNFLEDVRPTNLNGVAALNHILQNTQYPHPFSATGNVDTINTQYYIRKNPVEAILGSDSLVSRWGGEIERDNYRIIFLNRLGRDRGVNVYYGKNLLGLEVNINTDSMITRLMPQGNDELLLPERYIDSELIDEYAFPYIKKVDFNIGVQEATEDQEEITEEEAIQLLRQAAKDYMKENKTDIPDINIKVDLLLLENTEEYKNFKQLEKVHLGDTVSISKNPLGLEFKSRVIRVRKDLLTNRNVRVEIGNPEGRISETLNKKIEASNTELKEQINIVQIAANGKNRIFRSEMEPEAGMSENDLWYKPVGDGETELYRYDGSMWKLEKVSAGLLGGTLDAENGDVDLINVNVNNLVGNISEFVKSHWNAINSRASIDGEKLRFTHSDGSYTQIGAGGLQRFFSGSGKHYHYLIEMHTFTYGESSNTPRWIQLSDEFKGKPFKVYMAIADSLNVASYHWALQRFVCTGHPNYSIDYSRARIPIIAYKSETKIDGVAPRITPVQGLLIATY